MISAIEIKKCMVSAGIFSIVVSELHHGKKSCPIILLEDDKSLEVSFHCTILHLSLAVCLRVEGGRESPLDAKEIAE